TRFSRDWSSDVCSSDLDIVASGDTQIIGIAGRCDNARNRGRVIGSDAAGNEFVARHADSDNHVVAASLPYRTQDLAWKARAAFKVGRASCRESVEMPAV